MRPHSGELSAIFASLALSWSIVVGTVAAKAIEPLLLFVLSYAVISLLLLPFSWRSLGALRAVKRDFLFVLGARWLLGSVLLAYGFRLTLGIRASFLTLLEFVLVLAWSRLLAKEPLDRRHAALATIVVFGGFLLITNGQNIFTVAALGDLLVVGAMLVFSGTYLPMGRMAKRVPPATLLCASMGLAALILSPLLTLLPAPSADLGLLGLYVALLAAGYLLWTASFRTVKPWLVVTLLTIQTIAGAALSWLWLQQTLAPVQLAGAALMLAAVWLLSRMRSSAPARTSTGR